MLGRVLGIVRKDWAYTRRENILVYMVLMPLFLALLFRLFVPSMEQMELALAVDHTVPDDIVTGLMQYGRVETYATRQALIARVLELDDVPGIYFSDNEYKVLLEGNEQSYVRDLPSSILDYLLSNHDLVETSYFSRGATGSEVREISAVLLAYMGIQIGGLSIGLSIVNERENKAIRALAVSPVSTFEYIAGKSLMAICLGTGLAVLVSLIFVGTTISYWHLVGATLAGAALAILIGLVLGLMSDNQITAIAVVKALFVLIIGVPVASLFLPQHLAWLAYPFPNYWSFVAIHQVFGATAHPIWLANSMALGASTAMLALLIPPVRRRLRLG